MQVYEYIKVGMLIPKPRKGFTEILNKSENGFYYCIGAANKKIVTKNEIEEAYKEIMGNGCINRNWFQKCFPKKAKNNPCNFTSIGGVFVLLGIANYSKGTYFRK